MLGKMKDSTPKQTIQDGQEEPRPLRVIIIGAGVAGLTLGIALRQNGHDVEVSLDTFHQRWLEYCQY